MTPQTIRWGLAASSLLTLPVVINLLVLQPSDGRGPRPDRPYRGLADLPGTKSTTIDEAPTPKSQRDRPAHQAAKEKTADEIARERGKLVGAVQVALAKRGYVVGANDGNLSLVTRASIMAFEHDRRLPLSAEVSPALLAELESDVPLSVSARPPSRPSAQAEALVKTVQQSLAQLGHQPGQADGIAGDATGHAIRQFERSEGLPETGRISGLLMTRLVQRADTAGTQQR